MTKKCRVCQLQKCVEKDFPKRDSEHYTHKCKACTKAWKQAYNKKNLERQRQYERKRKAKITAIIRSNKERPCTDCGIQYPYYVMEYDHRDPEDKLFAISNVFAYKNEARLYAEIRKCDVVCSNCHRERTHHRRLTSIPCATLDPCSSFTDITGI